MAALGELKGGAHVLDLPCGTGRLTSMLVTSGFRVTGADSSSHMVELARAAWHDACAGKPDRQGMARYEVQDIMGTTFVDRQFDAVICNRLFHHFIEPEVRRAALTELRRICSGPIVVSFFNSFSIEAVRLAFLRVAFHRFRRDRIPISARQFDADAQSAGLILDRIKFTRWGISPQCYAVFRAEPGPGAGTLKGTGPLAA